MSQEHVRVEELAEDGSVSELELFFDLVFVFAFIRVTDLLAADTSAVNLIRSLLVLSVLWWTWVGYSWLGNVARADRGVVKVAMFGAIGASLVLSLTMPEAFDDLPGGLDGPLVLALAYLGVRLLHLGMFLVISRGDPQLRGQVMRWTPSIVLSTTLLLVASQTSGTAQTLLWVGALAGDYGITMLVGADWRLRSAHHFAERHGLIVIVALGESIVSIGIGAAGWSISWPILTAALLGLAAASLLWWLYFDVTAIVVEHRLAEARGADQIRVAQVCYTYLHLPMVLGIIGLAVGLKKVITYVGDDAHDLSDALIGIPLYTMYGGVMLFIVALLVSKAYAVHEITTTRVVVVIALLAIAPLATAMPALVSLAVLVMVLVGLVVVETFTLGERRRELRQHH